jgi:hypothetical protein
VATKVSFWPRRSIDGSILRSTETRPVETGEGSKRGVSRGFSGIGRKVLPGAFVRDHLQIRGVTNRGEGKSVGLILISAGGQRVTSWGIEDPADFCRKMADVFGAEIYRISTGVSGLGKSAAKETRH